MHQKRTVGIGVGGTAVSLVLAVFGALGMTGVSGSAWFETIESFFLPALLSFAALTVYGAVRLFRRRRSDDIGGPVKAADLESFRTRFNETSESMRVVAFVSPTCLVCQYGAGALRVVLDLGERDNVAGLVAWIPMMAADDREAAATEAARLSVAGVEHVWDGEKALGDAFAKTLGLTCSTWDVYMLYAPAITWEGDVPPEPTFWMHQLQSSRGAPAGLVLNPKSFLERYFGLLDRAGEATDDLALLFHAYALSAVKTDRAKPQPTLEDIASTQL